MPQDIHAPYNFVPLSQPCFPTWSKQVSHDIPFSDGLSGTIHLNIKAESPILVGSAQTRKNSSAIGHIPFFQLPDGTKAIPPSSLKGAIRNVLEIATFSKMKFVDDRALSVRDLSNPDLYGRHFTKGTKNEGFESRTQTGWLTMSATNGWQITPCDYARVEQLEGNHRDGLLDFGFKQKRDPNIKKIASRQFAHLSQDKYAIWEKSGCSLNISFDHSGKKNHPHRNKELIYQLAKNLGKGSHAGRIVFTGQPNDNGGKNNFSVKHMEFIFFQDSQKQLPVSSDVMKKFIQIYSDTSDNKKNDWLGYWEEKLKQGKRVPIFYLADNNGEPKDIGLSQMFRLAYKNTIGETIAHTDPKHLGSSKYDMSELILGSVEDHDLDISDRHPPLKSRVQFTLAKANGEPSEYSCGPTVLSSPKPTYLPNYLEQKTKPDGKSLYNQRSDNKNSPNYQSYSDNAKIRGWKRYPARFDCAVPPPPEKSQASVQVQLHPLDKGTTFTTSMHFHNLKPIELGALLWTLTWDQKPTLRHSIGMGKSFGLGQVTFSIDENKSTILNNNMTPSDQPINHFIDAFKKYMDSLQTGWEHSNSILQLMAMANPELAKSQPELTHMVLSMGRNGNEFQQAKNEGSTLPPYASFNDYKKSVAEQQDQQEIEDKQKKIAEEKKDANRILEERKLLPPWEQAILNAIDAKNNESIKNDGNKETEEKAIFAAINKDKFGVELDEENKKSLLHFLQTLMETNKSWRITSAKRRPHKDKKYVRTTKVVEWMNALNI